MNKPERKITEVMIVPAEVIFRGSPTCVGRFVALGKTVEDDRFGHGNDLRTSLIENIDIKRGIIETINTLYKIV